MPPQPQMMATAMLPRDQLLGDLGALEPWQRELPSRTQRVRPTQDPVLAQPPAPHIHSRSWGPELTARVVSRSHMSLHLPVPTALGMEAPQVQEETQ